MHFCIHNYNYLKPSCKQGCAGWQVFFMGCISLNPSLSQLMLLVTETFNDRVIMAVTNSSPFLLFWVLWHIGSYSCLSPAEETVATLNLWFILTQTTLTLEQKDKQGDWPVHKVLTELKVVLSWSDAGLCFAFSIRKSAFAERVLK